MAGRQIRPRHTVEQIQAAFGYDPDAGLLSWTTEGRKPNVAARIAGTAVGSFDGRYIRVKFGGTCYRAHQLAWVIYHGGWPVGVIDHINGNGADNRIANLRDVTHSENMRNLHTPVRGWSGRRGVAFSRVTKGGPRWTAQFAGKYLGTFRTPQEASRAYEAERRKNS